MTNVETWAVIMAGGVGTRFWPASRKSKPKQFLRVTGKKTLIQETVARLGKVIPPERCLVVTGREHVELVTKQLRKLPPENVLAEPVGRNTTPCVAWAALEIARRAPDSVHAVLPSDSVIRPAAEFQRLLRIAIDEASASDVLVTFGVRPTFAATGYGYIEIGDAIDGTLGGPLEGKRAHAVRRFVEKPDRARAEEFVASGRYLWNSGMFVWRTRAILAALRAHAPSVLEPLERCRTRDDVIAAYPTIPSVAIDVAVLERAENVRVVPFDIEWNDVGAWPALADVGEADAQGNVTVGGAQVITEDALRNVIHAPKGELIALVGVSDLVIVRAGKALLVCPKDRAQDVKRIVDRLSREDPSWT